MADEDDMVTKKFGRRLLDYLKDPHIGVIKHSGFKGVGRWRIAEHAAKMAMESGIFDVLIWLKLSEEEQRPGNLQKRIAECLRIEFSTTTNGAEDPEYHVSKDIANSIEAKLNNARFLLVLGDVLESIDLMWIGVPNTMKTGWKKTRTPAVSKVVLVTTLEDTNFKIPFDDTFRTSAISSLPEYYLVHEEAVEAAQSLKRRIGNCFTADTVLGFLLYLSLITSDEPDDNAYLQRRLIRYSIVEGFITYIRQGRGEVGEMNKDKTTEEEMILAKRVIEPLFKELGDLSFVDKNHKVPSNLKKLVKNAGRYVSGKRLHYKFWWIEKDSLPLEDEYWRAIAITIAMGKKVGVTTSLPSTTRWHNLTALFITCQINTYDEVLDIPPTLFNNMQALRVLELHYTPITSLPSSLSSLSNLRLLWLQGCQKLTSLPISLQYLNRLEFLELSDCTSLQTIPQETFKHMRNLRHLDLSNAKITSLPWSVSNLSGLQLLVLASCMPLIEIPEKSFENMQHLEVLNLSNSSSLESLPSSLSNLVSLKQLYLGSCSSLRTGLGVGASLLKALSSLEVLDLHSCSTLKDVQDLSFGDLVPDIKYLDLRGLRSKRLSFRGCHRLEHLELGDHENLEVLDLSSTTQLKMFYFKINPSSGGRLPLRRLDMLPNECRNTQDPLFQGLNWPNNDVGACIWVADPNIFENISEQVFETKCFSRFQIRVSSSIEEKPNMPMPLGSILGTHLRRIYKKIHSYFQTRFFSYFKGTYDRHLEIYGCKSPFQPLRNILRQAELLTLFGDTIAEFVIDPKHGLQAKGLKECRIASCQSMKSIFCGYHGNTVLESLEVLWVSDLPQLITVYRGKYSSGSFAFLKHMHLEHCPKLVTVFTSGFYLNNLETLEIKFCSRLKDVFGDKVPPGEISLQRLESLYLWELPKLESICEGYLPKLQKMRIRGCRKLTKLPLQVHASYDESTGGSVVEIEGELDWWNHLQRADHEVDAIKHSVHFRSWRLLPFTLPTRC